MHVDTGPAPTRHVVSSSSTAVAGSKHAREEQGDVAETSLAKRPHLEEDGEGKLVILVGVF